VPGASNVTVAANTLASRDKPDGVGWGAPGAGVSVSSG
jgi:hypothetical protein